MPDSLPMMQPLMIRQKRVAGVGQLVWKRDHAGGAPLEFAVMAARLGDHGIIASRVGTDAAGRNTLDELAGMPVDLSFLQLDVEYPTGTVRAAADAATREHYSSGAAWDHLDFSPAWRDLAPSLDAVWFDLLGQRNVHARKAIQSFLAATDPACLRIFEPRWGDQQADPAVLHPSLSIASILKVTEAELATAAAICSPHSLDSAADGETARLKSARGLLARFPAMQMVCVSLARGGSVLVDREYHHAHPGYELQGAVTPAFTAALVHYALDQAPLAVLNEAGSRWGAWAAAHPGRIPPLEASTLAGMARAIEEVRR